MEGSPKMNLDTVEEFEKSSSFEDVLGALEDTRDKLVIIKRIPGFEKDVTDLEIRIANLEERLSTIRN